MEPFYFVGGALAVWAVVVTALGLMREGFPASKSSERIVTAISVVLALAAISTAVIAAASESEKGGASEHAALLR
jgi:hypothetical protein